MLLHNTQKKLIHHHTVANLYLIICDCFTNNKSLGRLWSTLPLGDTFKHQFYVLGARVFCLSVDIYNATKYSFRDQHMEC